MRPLPSLIPRFNPDYKFRDLVYSLGSISANSVDLRPLENEFSGKFFFTNYGRTSLYLILKSLNLPRGSKVGVPLYSCTVVFDAVIKAGYTPCFIDIDIDNYTIDLEDLKTKIEDLSALVVIHTFGRPADMDKIKKIADSIPVVEDCAHSLLSEYRGKKTGTMSTASFFSLSKYISCGGGGIALINDERLIERIKEEIEGFRNFSLVKEIKHPFTAYFKSFFYHKPWFGLFSLPIGSMLEKKVDLTEKSTFNIARIARSDLNLMLNKLNSFRDKVEAQRSNSFFLINELEGTSLKLPYESKNTYCNYYLFPVLFDNEAERDRASEYLRDKGIDNMKMYSETPSKAKSYGYDGTCFNTEELVSRILIVPNHFSLKKAELQKIAEHLREVT